MPHPTRASLNGPIVSTTAQPAALQYRVGTRCALALLLFFLGLGVVDSDLEEPTLVALTYSVGALLTSLVAELSMVWYAPRWLTGGGLE